VEATVARGRVNVRRTLVQDTPTDLDLDDTAVVGAWVREVLREAGFPVGRAVIAVGREHVGLKRLSLPTTDPDELPQMTRLALLRDLPFDADSAVIDFVPLKRAEGEHDHSTTVLAVAAPKKLIDYTAQWAGAAGLTIERIALRTTGSAALLASIGDSRSPSQARMEDGYLTQPPVFGSALLGIDVVGEGVEFCVVGDGAIRFSRAAEVPAPQDQLAMADAVVTEARRTWMSYRAADDPGAAGANPSSQGGVPAASAGAAGVSCAYIMGDRRVAEYAAGPLAQMLKIPVQVLREHPRAAAVETPGQRDGQPGATDMDRIWPLAGMLLEKELGMQPIDFLRPRRSPDLAARKRKRLLLAAAALVLVGGGLWTALRFDLRNLRSEADRATALRNANTAEYDRVNRDRYKLAHLKQWEAVRVDWLEHAKFLAQAAPPPEQVVLDSWSGNVDFRGVTYDLRQSRWSAEHQTTIVIEGEARDRATADAFRELLTQNSTYTTTTAGADTRGGKRMPFGFTYRLLTRAPTPSPSPESIVGRQTSADRPQAAGKAAQPPRLNRAEATDPSSTAVAADPRNLPVNAQAGAASEQ
jgi:hypothetical protein